MILNFNFYLSTLSPEGESDSESSGSDDDLESPGGKASNVAFEKGCSPKGSPVKQPPAMDNKMDVDPTDGMLLLVVYYRMHKAVTKGCNLLQLSMLDFPLMLQLKLPVIDRIHPPSNKFATENKATENNGNKATEFAWRTRLHVTENLMTALLC